MKKPAAPLQLLCDAAIMAARTAGEYIQQVDRSTLQQHFKQAGNSAASQLVTEVDLGSEALIRQQLAAVSQQYDIAFVGEESTGLEENHSHERFNKAYFWCVDPLDGTLPFVEGRPGYAVSIALVDQSGKPLLGVVYDPVASTLLHAIAGQGAFRNHATLLIQQDTSKDLLAFADSSLKAHESYNATLAGLRHCGLQNDALIYGNGAVKNACLVLNDAPACYVKLPKAEAGGGSIWDFAASACIVKEAGGWVSDIHGQPLALNRRDSNFMNHKGIVYASSANLARRLIDFYRAQADKINA